MSIVVCISGMKFFGFLVCESRALLNRNKVNIIPIILIHMYSTSNRTLFWSTSQSYFLFFANF